MPNWCGNTLSVNGNRKEISEFKKKAKKEGTKEFVQETERTTDLSFNNFVPIPKELEGTTSPSRPETDEEKQKSKELIEKYKADNWYDWRLQNWGTKWDVEANLSEKHSDSLVYEFDTAWSPPVEWLRKVSKLFPKLIFTLEYREPGVGFAGEATAENGDVEEQNWEYDYEEKLDEV